MDTYEEEMYKYLTTSENFISAYEISQKFEAIKNKVLEDFWGEVEKELSIKVEASKNKWKRVDSTGKLNGKRNDAYALDLPFKDCFTISFDGCNEKVNYGLWFDSDNLNTKKIKNYSKSIELIEGMESNDDWICWQYIGDDFSDIETLKRILPSNREDMVNQYANLLFEFGEKLYDDIVEMSNMKK